MGSPGSGVSRTARRNAADTDEVTSATSPPPYDAPYDVPLAAPRTVPLRKAEPAKIIGWLILAGWGTLGVVFLVEDPEWGRVVFPGLAFGLMLGFMQSHRHPGTRFARWWIAFFTGFIVVAGVAVKVADLVLTAGE